MSLWLRWAKNQTLHIFLFNVHGKYLHDSIRLRHTSFGVLWEAGSTVYNNVYLFPTIVGNMAVRPVSVEGVLVLIS